MPYRSDSTYQRIYAVVRRVPRGRVATYGQVARLAGLAGQARLVGYALHALAAGTRVPWHRVINARGEVSLRTVRGARTGDIVTWRSGVGRDPPAPSQRFRLEAEGVEFDARGRVGFGRYGWRPRGGRIARSARPA